MKGTTKLPWEIFNQSQANFFIFIWRLKGRQKYLRIVIL